MTFNVFFLFFVFFLTNDHFKCAAGKSRQANWVLVGEGCIKTTFCAASKSLIWLWRRSASVCNVGFSGWITNREPDVKSLRCSLRHVCSSRASTPPLIRRSADDQWRRGRCRTSTLLKFVGVLHGRPRLWRWLAVTRSGLRCWQNSMTNSRACQPTSVIQLQRGLAPWRSLTSEPPENPPTAHSHAPSELCGHMRLCSASSSRLSSQIQIPPAPTCFSMHSFSKVDIKDKPAEDTGC